MRFIIAIVIVVCCLSLFLNISTLKYRNPYKLTMIFGKKGSGKSTTLTRDGRGAPRGDCGHGTRGCGRRAT